MLMTRSKKDSLFLEELLLKAEFQDAEFKEVYEINFNNPLNKIYQEKCSDKDEFMNFFTSRYSNCIALIQNVKEYNPKRKNIDIECFTIVRNFILTTVIQMKKRLPYEDKFLSESLAIYLKQIYNMDV